MRQRNLGLSYASRRHFQIYFFENFWHNGSWQPRFAKKKFFLLQDSCASGSSMQILGILEALLAHLWVLLGDPLMVREASLSDVFDPLNVSLCIGILVTKFYLKNIPKNITTKQYDTLVQLRLVSKCLGRLTSKLFQTLSTASKHHY